MNLRSLVLCSNDKILRVLRRVLSDLEIGMEHSPDSDSAASRLARQRFEAVIVDCHDEAAAARVLGCVRAAPCNKHAIAVAIIDGKKAVRSAFTLGAHFVLYEPLSVERAKASFRAARALMKCERRRNTRLLVEIPVTLMIGGAPQKTTTADLSEGGVAVRKRIQNAASMRIKFVLPGSDQPIDCAAEVAWENGSSQSGVRFVDLPPDQRAHLKAWLVKHSPDMESDDPPVPCKLTDLSMGGCYLEMPAPFPVRTRVILGMQLAGTRVEASGIVRVMHPEIGMGVEFARATAPQSQQAEKFIEALMGANGLPPELAVEPDGMEEAETPPQSDATPVETSDPLLGLFRRKTELTADGFLSELRKQRGSAPESAQAASV